MPDALDLTCPCEDGLPDPCTVCGVGAEDGACELDRVNAERQSDAYAQGRFDAFTEAIDIMKSRPLPPQWSIVVRGIVDADRDAIAADLQQKADHL